MTRYQVVQELGRNREGGRITYLATDTSLNPPQLVVIKEFRFALEGANWSAFKAYEREIEVLRELEHPRIPRYLDSFETKTGFSLVQEYKNAPSLAEPRSLTPEDIKQIAVSVLEILVYLQQRTPPVIHRDIKPENILVDEQLNAYLVDFGFARIRGGELAVSSVAAGTPGFMPPEEQFGRPLTEASDLYSLGATLICLLTGTRSVEVGNLIDDNYRFDFKGKLPQLSPGFISWLEKMVVPNVKQRYPNAAVALEALKPIQVVGGAGGASWVESLVGAVKGRKRAAAIALATVGLIAGVRTTLTALKMRSAQQDSTVRQLLQTRVCPRCNLQFADLRDADLRGANLTSAILNRAYLGGANLTGANLGGASLGGAHLWGANLTGAKLRRAYMWGVNLTSANLGSADLSNVNLGSAKLRRANLEGANLEGADLSNVNLGSAKLRRANLMGANLEGADLEGADLVGATMPDGTKHP